jgi:membrane protein implicated in regulation of membrane protease activity
MPESNTMVIGALILMGGILAYPFGDVYLKLFLIVVGTLFLITGAAQAVRRRKTKPNPKARFYSRKRT